MRTQKKHVVLGGSLLLCLLGVLLGSLTCNPWLAAAGGLGLCYLVLKVAYFGRQKEETVH